MMATCVAPEALLLRIRFEGLAWTAGMSVYIPEGLLVVSRTNRVGRKKPGEEDTISP